MPSPVFAEHSTALTGVDADDILDLLPYALRLGGRQVDLVQDRHDLVIVVDRLIDIGQGLGLHTLAGVHHQDRALAGGQGPADLIGEVYVAGRVHQVEDVVFAVVGPVVQPHGLGLDGDAPLALQVHGIENLLLHLPRGQPSGFLDQAIRQGRFAVVDVGDDGEVADAGKRGRHGPGLSTSASRASRPPLAQASARSGVVNHDGHKCTQSFAHGGEWTADREATLWNAARSSSQALPHWLPDRFSRRNRLRRHPRLRTDRAPTYSDHEIVDHVSDFFGVTAETAGSIIERTFKDNGRPTGYIAGEEGSGAFVFGLRYGKGLLYMKNKPAQTVYLAGAVSRLRHRRQREPRFCALL